MKEKIMKIIHKEANFGTVHARKFLSQHNYYNQRNH